MPLLITIPKSDLAKGKPLTPGWQTFVIKSTIAKPAKLDPKNPNKVPSVNYVITFKLKDDPDERELDHYFNSQALGFMAPFIAALSSKTQQEVLQDIKGDSLTFDLESTINKEILGKVEHSVYEGRIQSKIIDFAAPGKVPF